MGKHKHKAVKELSKIVKEHNKNRLQRTRTNESRKITSHENKNS